MAEDWNALPAWGWLFHVISPIYFGVISGPYWNNWVTLGPLHKCLKFIWVVVSNIWIMFTPLWKRWTQFEEHIFQMAWNHQQVHGFRGDISPHMKPISLNGHSGGGRENVTPFTPPMFNIAPEKWWFEDYFPFGARLIFRGELLNFEGDFTMGKTLWSEVTYWNLNDHGQSTGAPMVQVPPWQIKP